MEVRMTYVDWQIKGTKISACNCNHGCPCQFYAPPTYDKCEGVDLLDIEEGYFGDIDLGGIRVLMLAGWPGAIHEGDGVGQIIIDERADEAQREAIYKITSGEEQEPTTAFAIYASMLHEDYASLVKPIEMSHNLEARTATCFVDGVIEVDVQPIRNTVTDEPHHARVVLPNGFEFNEAELASSTFTGLGDWKFDYTGRTAIFSRFAYGPQGIVN
jgi:hypothetical protein